jgi:ribosome biogenesis protein BMS1
VVHAEDCSKCAKLMSQKWDEKDHGEIRNRFVSGNLAKAARNALHKANTEEEEEDEDVYGDFEDLETGENHENYKTDDAFAIITQKGVDKEAEERRLKKLALHAKFVSRYPFLALLIPV